MAGRGVDVVAEPQLLKVPQTLELRGVDDSVAEVRQLQVGVDHVVEDFGAQT